MKSILVATDFSANAASATHYAAALAVFTNARLILFHAFQLPLHASNTLLTPAGVDELIAADKKHLGKIAAGLATQYGIETTSLSKSGLLTDILDDVVTEIQAGLVVLGMHSNDWGNELFGNTTTSVIRHACYPVLVVPHGAVYKGVAKIIYAYDKQCLSNHNSLLLLQEVANKFGANVEVLHVETKQAQLSTASQIELDPTVEAAFRDVAHQYKCVTNEKVVSGIVAELTNSGADMLAVVPGKDSFWKRLAHHSTTRALALQVPVPLLVLPNNPLSDAN